MVPEQTGTASRDLSGTSGRLPHSLFEEGKQASTIKNYRLAITAIHRGFPDGSTPGNNGDITQPIRGMANRRPRTRWLAPSWSPSAALQVLTKSPYELLASASLAALSKKTLFLITLASARRRSCLHALPTKQNHIRFENHGRMVPDPSFIPKNQVLSFLPGDIFIPEIKTPSSVAEDKLWGPVRALKWYLNKTQPLRGTTMSLFILPRAPFSTVSKDTLSRWLMEIIRPFAVGTTLTRAHDIRGKAASTALFAGVPIEVILKAAAWRTPTTFVACYLSDSLQAEEAFCSVVMRDPAGTRSHPSGLPPSGSATRCIGWGETGKRGTK
ncbi:uncharacterized protein [Apostichopus japonicus]|uniref:uncharacterized protein n=1 Tax=Stichopus japonicus TaxID=307972 RepID=UPI003AB7B80F